MVDRATPARAIRELARFCLVERNQIFDGSDRERRMNDQHLRYRREPHDWREIALLERELAVDARVDRVSARVSEGNRVAIRWRLGSHFGADVACRTAAVVDDDLLAQRITQPRTEEARERVGAAAGRPGHDPPNRFTRIRNLRPCQAE